MYETGSEEEVEKLVKHLDRSCSAYGLEISAGKTKLMTNNPRGISTDISANGEGLETVNLQIPGSNYIRPPWFKA